MDAKAEAFYHEILADLRIDSEEWAGLTRFFEGLNPPPDKLVWLRATAFRLGCGYLSGDSRDRNEALLRTISAIVHCLETTRMVPRNRGAAAAAVDDGGGDGGDGFDPSGAETMIRAIYEDRVVDTDENSALFAYFRENIPPVSNLVDLRRTAFTVALEYLSEDDRDENVKLFRCINFVVNAFEKSCLVPKPYELRLDEDEENDLGDVSLSEAVQKLWDLDHNRLAAGSDYRVSVQGGKKPYWREDKAGDPLFEHVDPEAFKRPTYRAFAALLDNYTAETGTAERVTAAERAEDRAFLEAVMETAPVRFCHRYLHRKDPDGIPADKEGFLDLLHRIWFGRYRREKGGPLDSSGFEHVFVGEIRDGKITGFHNWIRFYLEERKGSLDYRGYIKPRRSNDDEEEAETDANDALLTLQFRWRGVEKTVGTTFLGTSPEFEMALYTICFLSGEPDNRVTLRTGTDEFLLSIRSYTHDRDKVGTVYPEALAHHD